MSNQTSPLIPARSHGTTVQYVLIPVAVVIIMGITGLLVMHQKNLLDQLRHQLIPVYTYDPSEIYWDAEDSMDEEQELKELLNTDAHTFHGQLSLRNSLST
ncbi:small integral membrane protein 29-like [Acipenser oxyrinchus oxyrinchus]|uniref:Small integral membrane protein 29-like n=1 Tax=Acipenser oxyrinchus oxyrinchus TaxID=40147 RepID=A0AAD8G8C1_ACIOX|nr:small integral membrane protein 29-like [Acipenser oxyrinchus oxyrinchus]